MEQWLVQRDMRWSIDLERSSMCGAEQSLYYRIGMPKHNCALQNSHESSLGIAQFHVKQSG